MPVLALSWQGRSHKHTMLGCPTSTASVLCVHCTLQPSAQKDVGSNSKFWKDTIWLSVVAVSRSARSQHLSADSASCYHGKHITQINVSCCLLSRLLWSASIVCIRRHHCARPAACCRAREGGSHLPALCQGSASWAPLGSRPAYMAARCACCAASRAFLAAAAACLAAFSGFTCSPTRAA